MTGICGLLEEIGIKSSVVFLKCFGLFHGPLNLPYNYIVDNLMDICHFWHIGSM